MANPLILVFNKNSPNRLAKKDWDIAIDKLLKLPDEHFTDGSTDELTI
jgi:hypothetical protein